MSEVLVIGHRNPDTDAICSAIGYAEFKRRSGMRNVVAARCGDLNDRINFVLKTFGMPAPKFVADVSPKVRDVMQSNVVSVSARTTVAEALGMMDDRNIRVLPILNENRSCKGLVSVFKMSKFFFPAPNRVFDSRRVLASLRNLSRTVNGRMLHVVEPDKEEDLIMMIGAMSLDSFAQRLPNYKPERILVIVGDRVDVQELAINEKVKVMIVTGGLPVDPAILEKAKEKGVSIIVSPHDTATTAMLCRAAITVTHMSHEHFLTFRDDEPLAGIQALAAESGFQAFPIVNDESEVVGILSKSDFLKKVERQLILVDHNELSQAVIGADQVDIIEVVDHHRIGTFTTQQPILFRNEPVGSTSTIVADCFFRYQVEMPTQIAGLLLAGLVSDTLNLTSPTTTERDAQILSELEVIAGVNAAEFTEKLFASGSVLISRTPDQAITTDCKEYVENGLKFSVAQIEEIGFDQFWKRKDGLVAALDNYRQRNSYVFAALLITDVVCQTSLLLVAGEKAFQGAIDYPESQPGIFELKDVVSRKKQLLPYLTGCLHRMRS